MAICSFEIEVPKSEKRYLTPNRVEISMIDFEKGEVHYSIERDTKGKYVECILPLQNAKLYDLEVGNLVSVGTQKVSIYGYVSYRYEISISQIVFKPMDGTIGAYAKLLIKDTKNDLYRYENVSLYKVNIWYGKKAECNRIIFEPNISYLSLKDIILLDTVLALAGNGAGVFVSNGYGAKKEYENQLPKEKIYD